MDDNRWLIILVDYNNRTLFSRTLEIHGFLSGNHPHENGLFIQVSELLWFTQILVSLGCNDKHE